MELADAEAAKGEESEEVQWREKGEAELNPLHQSHCFTKQKGFNTRNFHSLGAMLRNHHPSTALYSL